MVEGRRMKSNVSFESLKHLSSHDRRWQKKGASDCGICEFIAHSACGVKPTIVISWLTTSAACN